MPRVTTKAGATRRRPSNKETLDTLFQPTTSFRALPGAMMVKRENIIVLPQIRSKYNDTDIMAMRESVSQVKEQKLGSIEDTGILQPLLVEPIPGTPNFNLRAGHRRFLSTGDWNGLPILLDELPCVPVKTAVPAVLQLIENHVRTDISAEDECRGVRKALNETPLNQAQLADMLGEGRGWVENRHKVGKALDPDHKEYQEDLDLWLKSLPLYNGKSEEEGGATPSKNKPKRRGPSLSQLMLLVDAKGEALRSQMMAALRKGISYDALLEMTRKIDPKLASGRGGYRPAPEPDPHASPRPTPTGVAGPQTEQARIDASEARFYSQVGVPHPSTRSIVIGPSTPGTATPVEAAPGAMEPQATPPSVELPEEESLAGEVQTSQTSEQPSNDGPTPSPQTVTALTDYVYPANEQLAVAAKLLADGELAEVTEEQLRIAVNASQERVTKLRELYRQKLEAQKEGA